MKGTYRQTFTNKQVTNEILYENVGLPRHWLSSARVAGKR